MKLKKILKTVLFPHVAVLWGLLPVCGVFLGFSVRVCGARSVMAAVSYAAAFYTLAVWCLRVPALVRAWRHFSRTNAHAVRWREDTHFRMRVLLYGNFIWNGSYAALHLGMGIWHRSFWFLSLAAYYFCLALMRFFLLRHANRYESGKEMEKELRRYRGCGILLLVMNLALALMVFFMVYWNRSFVHHEITTIALAAYTFTAFALAIYNLIKYRKHHSPVYSASKIISFASACVSMLTLESGMLSTFGGDGMGMLEKRIMLAVTGGVVCAVVIAMASYMIVQSTHALRLGNAERRGTMEEKRNGGFQYTYSAKQQAEIKAIRQKYASEPVEEDKMERLRRLDSGVTAKASAYSLIAGILGALIMGFGMSLVMTDLGASMGLGAMASTVTGIAVGVLGCVPMCLAYPIYNRVTRKEREKIAPEVLRLTDELMK